MILALSTAQSIHELALLSQDPVDHSCTLIKEARWPEDRKDVESLVPRLQELLNDCGATKEEITALVVVKGPGSFTSLRTGVAFANALAEGLRADQAVELYEMSTFEALARKAASTDPLLVLLPAGGLDAGLFYEGTVQVGPLSTLLAKIPHNPKLKVVAELSETLSDELKSLVLEKGWKLLEAHELQTLGESLQTLGLRGLEKIQTVEPLYLRGPKITLSSDPWKQPRA